MVCSYLQTIIFCISLSVDCIPREPISPRFLMVFSMSLSMMPSVSHTQVPLSASTLDWIADATPEATFMAQPTLAPSQTIPVMLPIIFFIAEQIS